MCVWLEEQTFPFGDRVSKYKDGLFVNLFLLQTLFYSLRRQKERRQKYLVLKWQCQFALSQPLVLLPLNQADLVTTDSVYFLLNGLHFPHATAAVKSASFSLGLSQQSNACANACPSFLHKNGSCSSLGKLSARSGSQGNRPIIDHTGKSLVWHCFRRVGMFLGAEPAPFWVSPEHHPEIKYMLDSN